MEIKILEPAEIVVFEILLKIFLKILVFIFHLFHLMFERLNLFLQIAVIVLQFLDPAGLENYLLILF